MGIQRRRHAVDLHDPPDGLTYSDGSPLNAERFAYSIKRNIDPTTAGEYAPISDEIAGAPEWRACGEDAAACEAAAAPVAESVKAQPCRRRRSTRYDDTACNTLTLTFSKPAPYWHTVAALWITFPAKEELITAGGETWWNRPITSAMARTFSIRWSRVHARSTCRTRSIGTARRRLGIDFSYIPDSAVAFEAYKNNELDIIPLGAEDLEVVAADPELSAQLMRYSGSCTFAVMFHQLKEPFTDQKVREAFAYSLDREGWVNDVLRGLGSPTLTWIPPGFPGYDANEARWGFDPEKAKQAIADSSYGSIENLPPVTLTFSDTPRNRTRNEWLAAKFKEVLGVDAKLDSGGIDRLHGLDQGYCHGTADVHPGLVRRLSGSPELAERLLEDGRLWRTHRLLQSGPGCDDERGRCDFGCREAHATLRRSPDQARRHRPGGVHVEQPQCLPGQALGERHRDDAAGFLMARPVSAAQRRHRHRGAAQ